IAPRTGTNPITGTPLAPPSATSPTAQPINGHEWNIQYNDDLQYACIYPLPPGSEHDCTVALHCDCYAYSEGNLDPVCQNSAGKYGTTQYAVKAYPGTRHLEVLKGLGSQGLTTSICAAQTTTAGTPSYGYTPVIDALVARAKVSLSPP